MRIKPNSEQNVSKCNIPKKIKLFLSNISVTKLIKHDSDKSLTKRHQNFLWKFVEKLEKFNENPDISMKVDPIICAILRPKPVVASEKSM